MLKKKNYEIYLKYYKTESIDEYSFLLEAGQGKNINGNMFAFLAELCTKEEWKNYTVYWVVTEDTANQADERMQFYHYQGVQLVERASKQYLRLLASCKYLITDNSFPPYYIKREGQVVLNTWHGTPLKILGRQDIRNSASYANIQKNYALSDYVLFPNVYTRDIFMEDYSLKNLMKNKVVLADYPRNAAFYNEERQQEIRRKYHLENKQVIGYLPTWRGASRQADINKQKMIIKEYLEEIDRKLNDRQIFYVNLHFLIGNSLDLSKMKHIKMFPVEYETYDFLAVCDALVTDYSSVFFDYAVTGKKIVLFTYDLEEYLADRGMYFPIEELPFPRVAEVDGLIAELNKEDTEPYKGFVKEYCAYSSKTVVSDLLQLLKTGKMDSLSVEDAPYNGKENVFIHVDRILNTHHELFVRDYLNNITEDKNYIVLFRGKLDEMRIGFVENIPETIQICGYVAANNPTFWERILSKFILRSKLCFILLKKVYNSFMQREYKRRFGRFRIGSFVNLSDTTQLVAREMFLADGEKTYVKIPSIYQTISALSKWERQKRKFEEEKFDFVEQTDIVKIDENERTSVLNPDVRFRRLSGHPKRDGDIVTYRMWFLEKSLVRIDYSKMEVLVDNIPVRAEFKYSRGISLGFGRVLNCVDIRLKVDDLFSFQVHSRITFAYTDERNLGMNSVITYCKKRSSHLIFAPKIIKISDESCCYFRRTVGNTVWLTVRQFNRTDRHWENTKLNLAYYAAKLYRRKNLYLLYEKDASRYEESASVLYERLIDEGYKGVYFILDRDYPAISEISPKYRKNIVYKYSWRHYLYFFSCKTFIGTEALIHALELRNPNQHVLNKTKAKDNNHVFLQHGVMYMISLDSESRTFFKPRSIKQPGKYRVVTSSKAEAEHFINLGGYDPEQIYICGLPKFDRNMWNKEADKIVIMPTWRPWEYNETMSDFKNSKYYKMMERMFQAIPEEYKEKTVILPHPLFRRAAESNEFLLKKYMQFDTKYDEILRDTKVLITDYSSIAYDAFYRGANIIFYWEELEECLEAYGENTKLLLNEENIFGDICYNMNELGNVFLQNYTQTQQVQHVKNYKYIVEFSDGKNTERLMEALRHDYIIPERP